MKIVINALHTIDCLRDNASHKTISRAFYTNTKCFVYRTIHQTRPRCSHYRKTLEIYKFYSKCIEHFSLSTKINSQEIIIISFTCNFTIEIILWIGKFT